MAEALISLKSEDPGSRKLAKYEFVKLNMTESTSLDQINEELLRLQQELGNNLDEYEELARRLETFVKVLNTSKGVNQKSDMGILLFF